MSIAGYIDHTLLAADAKKDDIVRICAEAKEHHFASVCVNSCWVSLAASLLKGTGVHVCTVVGFPLGAMEASSKAGEAADAVRNGADEIDMVINIGFLKSGMKDEVLEDMKAVRAACR